MASMLSLLQCELWRVFEWTLIELSSNINKEFNRNTYLAITVAKLGLVTALKLSPVGRLRTGWVTNCEDRRKGPYVVLSFPLLLFCVLCGVIVNSVLKSRFSIISASGFRKRQKQRTNMARCSSPENYYTSGRNTELKQTLIYISAGKLAN